MTRPLPNWRSLLFVPVLAERFLAKAHTHGAYAIIWTWKTPSSRPRRPRHEAP